MVGVIVNGARGKMGQLAAQTISDSPYFELVAGIGRADDLSETIAATNASIVVDLTSAESVYENTQAIIASGAHPVIGASGLLPDQIAKLARECKAKAFGGIIVPNFSIAAVLMMRFAEQAAHYLPDVEIIEAHHQGKAEAPSGTALKTADLITKARTRAPHAFDCKEILPGALGAKQSDVPIHSMRLPGTLAEQTVMFGQPGETLSIKHQTIDRASFMPGVLLACERVTKLKELAYGLEHIL